jgi:hypothetical protein
MIAAHMVRAYRKLPAALYRGVRSARWTTRGGHPDGPVNLAGRDAPPPEGQQRESTRGQTALSARSLRPHNGGMRLPAVGSALIVAGLLCGCGSASSSASSSASKGSGTTSFAQCLKQHGVTLPSSQPGSGGQGQPPSGGVPAGGSGSAIQACSKYAPQGGGFGGGGGGANFSKLTKCLKAHGITIHGSGPTALQGLNRSSSKVQKAIQACQSTFQPGG